MLFRIVAFLLTGGGAALRLTCPGGPKAPGGQVARLLPHYRKFAGSMAEGTPRARHETELYSVDV